MVRVSLLILVLAASLRADEPVFSGPQPGEKLTAFKVLGFQGPNAGKEVELIGQSNGKPTLLLIVHEWTRPLFQLVRTVDAFADRWAADGLVTQVVMLSADRTKAEMFLQQARQSLNLKSSLNISLDGLEGPGNYGLNRQVAITILVAKDSKVVANFAIVQPNETDAPKVLAAVAKLLGKPTPTAEEIAQAGPNRRPAAEANQRDPELTQLMRQMIQLTNDEAKVQEIAAAMKKWAGDNPRKQTQLVDFCKQVLKLGYGSDAAKKALRRLAGE